MRTGTSHLSANRRYGVLGSTLERIKRFFNAGTVVPTTPGDPGELRLSVTTNVASLKTLIASVRVSLDEELGQEP